MLPFLTYPCFYTCFTLYMVEPTCYTYINHIICTYIYLIEYNIHLFTKWGEDEQMKLITLYLPETYIKALDQLVDERFYPNRAEAIRVAIRDLISAEVWRRNGVD